MRVSRLPRRTFLQGLGWSMGLPLLEAMLPQRHAQAAGGARPPVRMAFLFIPNGAIMPAWTPAEEGERYRLSETLEPLAAVPLIPCGSWQAEHGELASTMCSRCRGKLWSARMLDCRWHL